MNSNWLDRRGALSALAAFGSLAAWPVLAQGETPASRLAAMGVVLPKLPPPVGAYVPYTRAGSLLFIAGQLPLKDGNLLAAGRAPDQVTMEQAVACARQCAINVLAAAAAALDGDLSRIEACVKVTGYVACTPEFKDQSAVINGASDFFGAVLGPRGQHARAAVGVAALPRGAPVEVEAIFAIK